MKNLPYPFVSLTHLALCAALAVNLPAAADASQTFTVERFSVPGPVADARVSVKIALVDDRDPDGDRPCVGQLDITSNAARKLDFQVTLNASFFAVPATREFEGRRVACFVGNCGYPAGWHFSGGKLRAAPACDKFRATLIVHEGGRVSIAEGFKQLPADTRFAVSGSTSRVLKDPAIGVFAIANKPSDQAALPLSVERPVIDIIGIQIAL